MTGAAHATKIPPPPVKSKADYDGNYDHERIREWQEERNDQRYPKVDADPHQRLHHEPLGIFIQFLTRNLCSSLLITCCCCWQCHIIIIIIFCCLRILLYASYTVVIAWMWKIPQITPGCGAYTKPKPDTRHIQFHLRESYSALTGLLAATRILL